MGIKKKSKTEDSKKPNKSVSFSEEVIDNEPDEPPKKKKKKQKDDVVIKPSSAPTDDELKECKKPENIKSVDSKRQKKRMKYEKLKLEQKTQSQLTMQQKNLNYLSLWKHNRKEWKFNKIQQVWLQKHMFDKTLIPDESFETLVEYFSSAKGQIRKTILKECTEIIEKAEEKEETEDEEEKTKYKRARNMLQNLHE